MKISGNELETLSRILKQAYHEKEKFEVGVQWQNRVMAAVRQMGPVESMPRFIPTFEHLVWRLAPVTSLLMLGLAAVSMAMDAVIEYDLLQLFVSAIEESTLAHLFGG
jgi:hypothetical protein